MNHLHDFVDPNKVRLKIIDDNDYVIGFECETDN